MHGAYWFRVSRNAYGAILHLLPFRPNGEPYRKSWPAWKWYCCLVWFKQSCRGCHPDAFRRSGWYLTRWLNFSALGFGVGPSLHLTARWRCSLFYRWPLLDSQWYSQFRSHCFRAKIWPSWSNLNLSPYLSSIPSTKVLASSSKAATLAQET